MAQGCNFLPLSIRCEMTLVYVIELFVFFCGTFTSFHDLKIHMSLITILNAQDFMVLSLLCKEKKCVKGLAIFIIHAMRPLFGHVGMQVRIAWVFFSGSVQFTSLLRSLEQSCRPAAGSGQERASLRCLKQCHFR